jgi:GTP diphosphokinase / guanosine-3',5'-bis(diphosphate) 3'-diphosphatase
MTASDELNLFELIDPQISSSRLEPMNLAVAAESTPPKKVKAPPKPLVLPDWLQTCLMPGGIPNAGLPMAAAYPPTELLQGDPAHNTVVCQAFNFAYSLHEGQYRASGDPYIAHPIAVAGILRDLGGSSAMIAAGFLHDVVEDTEITLEEIEFHFGPEVRLLVEGVTKLGKIEFLSKRERQAENFRRMFMAMAKDIRVMLVKLADRLHNMRTLEHLSDENAPVSPSKPAKSLRPWPTVWASATSNGN